MPEQPDIDPGLQTWFDEDVDTAMDPGASGLDALWGTIEQEIDSPGWREPFVSASTPVRMGLGLFGMLAIGALLVVFQGLRTDLDVAGWATFAMVGGGLMVMGAFLALWPLRGRSSTPAPLWPWIPVAWLVVLAFATVAPWPGMTGVPSAMHFYCFAATSIAAVGATAWLALFEQSVSPVPQRIGLAAAGAGIGAFVFQSLFCPGVDVVHLLLGHAAPTLGLSCVIIGLALVFRR